MLLIPAIDLKDGACVRLKQGRMEDNTVFSDDPLAMAQRWVDAGARRLHLVDLDGAFAGSPRNRSSIAAICEAFPDLPIQVGGGIRDEETIEQYLDMGVSYVIIGTKAVAEPHFIADVCLSFPGHIIVGLDAKDGKVAIDGWSKISSHDVTDLARRFEQDGVSSIVFTDIARDGMMQGANMEATRALARAVRIPIIASGGMTDMSDIERLIDAADDGVAGAIIGRALYEGGIDLGVAQARVDERCGIPPFTE
ncbi:MAG: 1-(5-phosphoribosyl)-5-[(5-phosphoribosylamino)methylideneamino]imidazole-4-carboxamide isomerase [Halothiobacillus sp.]|jgi:phosphoribosylformimino-5-aminoimidazole carboxamide ribotide isomerase|uniref:1-(5-phosphoribosyl)-5-[(5- phosphoribosylamino)methylideneamino]imidazole-4- carboxamide isomerase n=1 Tax=Halothiobacillus sp. TaxID=1891311 RepID=UPI002AD42DCD|nr:1-(5-phosphoribosyl)-5-[(5-phosphoribosylamino)methylideneamino]imidazole-4-carboxamide isomerase [Halothiobacillus sp.]MDA3878214.1 1-(5-phosphoribosyl)-5-[(5-phosphoribosylamino)methylideneamino]imidazole-4-carboxamide isomerase [Halothiobacillus sp.]